MQIAASACAFHQSLASFFSASPFTGSRSASPPASGLSLFVLFGSAAFGLHLLRPPVSGLWSALSTRHKPLSALRYAVSNSGDKLGLVASSAARLGSFSSNSLQRNHAASEIAFQLLCELPIRICIHIRFRFGFCLCFCFSASSVFFAFYLFSVLPFHCSFPFPSGSCQLLVASC